MVLEGLGVTPAAARVYELAGYALTDENSFAEPERIVPKERSFDIQADRFDYEFPGHSVTVFRFNQ
ncbi:hypothetical protein D3C71_1839930 [compost metagenome]